MRTARSLSRLLVLCGLVSFGGCDGCRGEAPPEPEATDEGDRSLAPELTLGLPPDVAQRTLAVVDGEPVRVLDVGYELESLNAASAARSSDAEGRRALLERIVLDRALAGEARDRGLDRDPRVATAREDVLLRALVTQAERDVPAPTDDEVRGYYQQHRERYRAPELRSVSLIFTRQHDAAVAAIARMAADMQHISEAWRDVADEIGFMGPLAYAVEETEMFAREPRPNEANIPQEIRDIAFAGDIPSLYPEPLPMHDGWYLVRVVSGIDATDASYDEVREQIRRELHEQAIDAYVTTLVATPLSQATFDDEALETVHVPRWAPRRPGDEDSDAQIDEAESERSHDSDAQIDEAESERPHDTNAQIDEAESERPHDTNAQIDEAESERPH